MKARLLSLRILCLTVLFFSAVSPSWGTVLTFDDLPSNTGDASYIPNNYQGLVWSNFGVVNAILYTSLHGTGGTYYGMVSASNVAFNASGNPAEIDSPGNFDFLSAYLTGAWNSNLNIEVQGFRSGALLYDTTVIASATNATLFTFDYFDIDRLYCNSFGGQNAGFPYGAGNNFEMDNFTFEFIPEPSSLPLTAGGVLTLWAFLRRKRA